MFKLRIVTIERVAADQEVESLTINTAEGATTILTGHVPLLTQVLAGEVRYSSKGREQRFVSAHGSFEIKNNQAVLLVDEITPITSIDLKKAQTERERILNILESEELSMQQLKDARKDLANASAKIKAVGKKTQSWQKP